MSYKLIGKEYQDNRIAEVMIGEFDSKKEVQEEKEKLKKSKKYINLYIKKVK